VLLVVERPQEVMEEEEEEAVLEGMVVLSDLGPLLVMVVWVMTTSVAQEIQERGTMEARLRQVSAGFLLIPARLLTKVLTVQGEEVDTMEEHQAHQRAALKVAEEAGALTSGDALARQTLSPLLEHPESGEIAHSPTLPFPIPRIITT
jgi:hypothetical protein